MLIMYGFWIAGLIGGISLVVLMWKKKLYRDFPIFFALISAESSSDLLNFILMLRHERHLYYYTYWTGVAVTTCLGFLVLQEIFRHIFRPFESLRAFGSALFRWSALVLLMVGVIMAVSSGSTLQSPITRYIFTIDRSVQLMQCGLVLFMYLFARQLGLTEGHRTFGITIGLGVRAAVQLLTVTLLSLFTSRPLTRTLNVTQMAVYFIVVVVWIVYMYRKEPERRRSSVLEQTENWNYALAAATSGDSGSAFLPNVVDTVERVLNKRATSITSDFKPRA